MFQHLLEEDSEGEIFQPDSFLVSTPVSGTSSSSRHHDYRKPEKVHMVTNFTSIEKSGHAPTAITFVTMEDGEQYCEFQFQHEHSANAKQRRDQKPQKPDMYSPCPGKIKNQLHENLFYTVASFIIFVSAATFLLLPTCVILVVFVPIAYILRRIAKCFASICNFYSPCCCYTANWLTNDEKVWLDDPHLEKPVVQALLEVEGRMEASRLKSLLLSRVVSKENKQGKKNFLRFTQKMVRLSSGCVWVNDLNFNIDNHVLGAPRTFNNIQDLQEFISQLSTKQLLFGKPLWEVCVFYVDTRETLKTYLLFRFHPCMTDGISLVEILRKYLADEHATSELKSRYGREALMFNGVQAVCVGLIVFLSHLLGKRDISMPCIKPMNGEKKVLWSDPISLASVKRIKLITRTSINDVLLSAISGSLRSYFRSQGIHNPCNLHANIPVDYRSSSELLELGNMYTFARAPLTTNIEGAIPRLWELKHQMLEVKNSGDPMIIYNVMKVIRLIFPEVVSRGVLASLYNRSFCTVSNLPGPETKISLGGHKVQSVLYWMPTREQVVMSFSAITYGDELRVGLLVDEAAVTDPHIILHELNQQFLAMTDILQYRRIPGEKKPRNLDDDGYEDEDDRMDEEVRRPKVNRPSEGEAHTSQMRPLSGPNISFPTVVPDSQKKGAVAVDVESKEVVMLENQNFSPCVERKC
ncbi:probable diacyglycerol O-acyltransferase tgs1 isoform X2 [Anneissia japonica]|uniref:probable diacyglycerol O-acyltransferase tgs1 isoform X2 n=1 Tax=Anneissia japonica TaxID=1529436 RepID=UPI0014259F1B|nr:probable diacyglycerol O-acyltransferase tgs1 isoform X2 [Anneissia japonica]